MITPERQAVRNPESEQRSVVRLRNHHARIGGYRRRVVAAGSFRRPEGLAGHWIQGFNVRAVAHAVGIGHVDQHLAVDDQRLVDRALEGSIPGLDQRALEGVFGADGSARGVGP